MKVKEQHAEDVQVTIEHIFNAPRALVFKAWTNPDLLLQWFAPDGCTILFKEIDIRKGGKFHSCISNPIHGECWCIGSYEEVVDLEKIVYSIAIADENGNTIDPKSKGMDENWPRETKVTVTFTEFEGKTKLTLYQTVSESLAKKTGAYPSWIQMLERLEVVINS
ncbi:MAG: SRPBCC domain-containing protein [Bacteroidota bacterium]